MAYRDDVLALNPVAYWRLGEAVPGTGTAVDETGTYDGTYVGSPVSTTGLLVNDANTAVDFDLIQLMQAPISSTVLDTLNTSNAISLSVCYKSNGITSDNHSIILGYAKDNINGFAIKFSLNNDNIPSIIHNNGTFNNSWYGYAGDAVIDISDGNIHHLVAVYDGTSHILYIDGIEAFNITSTIGSANLFNEVVGMRIGEGADGNSAGTIDEVAIFDTALTQEQVTTLYNSSLGIFPITTTAFDITIDHTKVAADLYNFPLLVNLDSTSGTTALDTTNVFSELSDAGAHNFWRISVTDNNGGTYVAIDEIELRGIVGGSDNSVPSPASTITASSFVNASNNPTYAFDNLQLPSQWVSTPVTQGNINEWIKYDTNGTVAIECIELSIRATTNAGEQNNLPKDFTLEYSDDDTLWVNALTVTGEIGWASGEVRTFLITVGLNTKIKAIYKNPLGSADATINSQQCKVEIDRWDQANQQAQLWIKVPYISKDVDTVINLSYASTNEDNSANIGITGTTPAQEVWTEYDAVYHLSADGADSTVNALDGTLVNIDGTNIVDFGIGKGMTFDGVGEYIDIGLQSTFNILATEDMTVEHFIEYGSISTPGRILQTVGADSYTANEGWSVRFQNDTYQYTDIGTAIANVTQIDSSVVFALNDINQVVTNFKQSNGNLNLYEDGILVLDDTNSSTQGVMTDVSITSSRNVTIGCAWHSVTPTQFVTGTLKEIRFAKNLKSAGWIATNYDSTQDTLVSYLGVDAFILNKVINGTITETLAVTQWFIRSYNLSDGVLSASLTSGNGAFALEMPVGYWVPQTVTITPDQGSEWVPNTVTALDVLIFPNDAITTPYYYKCTVAGTTDVTEPTWPTSPGNTVVDNDVTWTLVERMIQPLTQSPLMPQLV